MPSISNRLLANFACAGCQGKLLRTTEGFKCEKCSAQYPVVLDTPFLAPHVQVRSRAEKPALETIDALIKGLSLHPEDAEAIGTCLQTEVIFDNAFLQVESEQLLDRLRNSGVPVPPPYAMLEPTDKPAIAIDNASAEIELSVIHWPKYVKRGEVFSLTIVVRNIGQFRLSSTGDTRFMFSYGWSCKHSDPIWTRLLIDLMPGRQISMPIQVVAPDTLGAHTLGVSGLVENVRWLDSSRTFGQVTVTADQSEIASIWPIENIPRDYREDHVLALDLLRDRLSAASTGKRRPIVVEIGGNFGALASQLADAHVVNLDIDPYGQMMRSIADSRSETNMLNIVADGTRLPFKDKSIDAIVMFATFHHFPEPHKLLEAIRQKLVPNGLLAILCEPVGHVFYDTMPPMFCEELEKGVYEQCFKQWEYARFVQQAGFKVFQAQVDDTSLKLFASPA